MGIWSDRINNTKFIILFANLWQIGGSFMYFVGLSKWFIISGRLVAGIGQGVLGCCFSEIVKTNTVPQERSKILARIMMGRQFGLILGPSINFIFLKFKFKLGPFEINNLNTPGLIMALLWLILELFVLFFYTNLNDFQMSLTNERTNLLTNEADMHTSYESFSNKQQQQHTNDEEDPIEENNNSENDSLMKKLYNEYIRDEVVAVFCINFTVFFMQTALETIITPITKQFFGWSDTQNSILYALAGLEILLVFVLLSFLTKKVPDRYLLLIGLIGNLSTLIFLLVYVPNAVIGRASFSDILLFAIPVFGNLFSLPFIALGSISAISNITSVKTQGLTQGIRRCIVGIATIYGPIWSGVFYGSWYFLFSSLIALVCISLLMLLCSFKRIKTNLVNR